MKVQNPSTQAIHKSNESQGTQQSQRANLKNYQKSSGTEAARPSSASDVSTAEFSMKAKDFAEARKVAMDAPDVREEKIAELKRRIQNNEYNVKPDAIADRLVNEHLASEGIL